MPGKLTEESQPIAEINIIPFVDIILVILIIFMVTTPFIIKTGFSIDLPKADSAEEINPSKVNITIKTDGRVLFNGVEFEPNQIIEQLKKKNIEPDKAHVIISADKNVLHGKVISVINIMKTIGLKKVAITTQPGKQND